MYVTTAQAEKVMGLGCSGCKCKGMGSIDLSTLSWEDWFLVGIGGAMFATLLFPSITEPSKPKRRSKKKKSSGGGLGFGSGAVSALILLGGGYLAYQYFVSQGTTG